MPEGVFLYYLPGVAFESVTSDVLRANPLISGQFSELIESPRMLKENLIGCGVVNRGPDNGNGCVIGMQPLADRGQVPKYDADTQTWAKYGTQWVGWQTDMRPGPESLRRVKRMSGYDVEMGDGAIWTAPTIRRFVDVHSAWQSQLPMTWGVDADMKPSMRPMEKHAAAWETSGQILSAIFFDEKPALMVQCFEWAVSMLQINYRISAIEAAILQLFNDDTILKTLHAAVDAETVLAGTESNEKHPT